MTTPVRVILADDHAILREMLATRLGQEADFEIVAAVDSAEAALQAARLNVPDLVVLDIDMPGLSPFAAARALGAGQHRTRVVFLSAFLRDGYLQQALEVEAAGYLVKRESLDDLVRGLRAVAQGRTAFSPAVRARMSLVESGVEFMNQPAGRLSLLTPRELETLHYLASGLSRKEIAGRKEISPKTVEQHCEHVMAKLDIHDRVELARFAIREGVLEP